MKILLAVDGSRNSGWAVDLLLKIPLIKEPTITVIHVVDLEKLTHPLIIPPLAVQYAKMMRAEVKASLKEADRLTARTAKRLCVRWKKVKYVVEKGHVVERIITAAGREKADLIILGSRGLSNIPVFLLGSVSQKVATYAPCSVLVVKKRIRVIKKILAAVDGSNYSKNAVKFLKSHFQPEDIRTIVLNVFDYPFAPPKLPVPTIEKKDSKILLQAGFKARAMPFTGHPAASIVEIARWKRADLVIVGSRGLTGFKKFYLGSVSHKVVKYSRSSVLVVRTR